VVDLADLNVLGDRDRRRRGQLAAMDDADADVRLADVDVARLLVDQVLGDRLRRVRLDLRSRDLGAGTHLARRLRIALLRGQPGHTDHADQTDHDSSHVLSFIVHDSQR
jgi:hypothetical protein